MSEPTPVFDPPVLENGTSAVEAEGSSTTTDNGALKENNGQDVTMAGLEESGAKNAKTGADPAVSVYYLLRRPATALLYFIHLDRIHQPHTQYDRIHHNSHHEIWFPTIGHLSGLVFSLPTSLLE